MTTEPKADRVSVTGPQEHGSSLHRNALGLLGNIGISLGSAGPTASVALTLAAIVAVSSFASPIAILICGLPMLAIAAAFRRLNRWRVNCGGIFTWGGRAISPYYGFAAGWIVILAYVGERPERPVLHRPGGLRQRARQVHDPGGRPSRPSDQPWPAWCRACG
jgi:hypothetical protein